MTSFIQPVFEAGLDQYVYSAGFAGFPGYGLLYLPDAPVLDGRAERFEEAARIDGANSFQIFTKFMCRL